MPPVTSADTPGSPPAVPVPLIEISGEPRERGRAYGESAREQVALSVAYYQEAFAASSGLGWADVLAEAAQWRPVVAAAAPHLLAEMDGIAEGAGRRPEEILALNARGEIVRSGDSAFGAAARPAAAGETDGCSSFALLPEATASGHVYCGQNWDWREATEATVVLVRVVQPPKPTVIMQVEAGQVGRHGVNSTGLALNANGLDGAFGTPAGLPQPVLRRLILDSATFTDALCVPFDIRQHIATNLLLTHRDGIAVDLETTPETHTWGYPADGVLVHGNHYQYGIPPALARSYRISSPDSLFRVPVIERGLRTARLAETPDAVRKLVRETMSDHFSFPKGVCAHVGPDQAPVRRSKTTMSSLVDLTAGEYRVIRGNPCESDYSLLPWDIYDGPSGPSPAGPAR
jgi:isopenicillin-N N-acyltransferase like protein